MKNHHFKILLAALTAFILVSWATLPTPSFSYKVYGNIANYFESENDLLDFFGFKKGTTVAEIGAADGSNITGLSILTDSVTFYAQDIDAGRLNQKNFDKVLKKRSKYKSGQTNSFHLCIGTERSSLLPEATFDKIILSSTFHEFVYMDEMLQDIYSKLKPGGRLYILESYCSAKKHKNYTPDETVALLKKHHFSLVKKDGKDLNGSTGLFRLVVKK